MSSSDGESRFGTIFMGPTEDREISLERLRDVTRRDITWDQQTEVEYMDRVKARATERVRALLLQARQRGDDILREAENKAEGLRAEAEAMRAEAEQSRNALMGEAQSLRDEAAALRDAARSEGYEEGRARAEEELAETRRGLAETTALVLLGIHEQCGHIYEAWRDDLAALLREAVEKGTSLVVDQDRAALLEELLDRSMRALLDRRRLIVRVNPVDAELVTDMLASAKRGGPHVESWELSTDSGLEPGSLVVESESGLVNNSRGVRRSVVDEVLEHLSLPEGRADEQARTAFTDTLVREMRAHGVDLQEEGQEAARGEGEMTPEMGVPPEAPSTASSKTPVDMAAAPSPDASAAPAAASGEASPKTSPEASAQASGKAAPKTPAQTAPKAADKAPADASAAAVPEASPSASPSAPSGAAQAQEAAAGQKPPRAAAPDAAASAKSAPAAPGPDAHASGAESDKAAPDAHALSEAEAQDMVQEFLGADGRAASSSSAAPAGRPAEEGLPPDVADELLADMGFGSDTHATGTPPGQA